RIPVLFKVVGVLGAPGTTYSVPLGQRLMIEFISGQCNTAPTLVNLTFTSGGHFGSHIFPIPVAAAGFGAFILSAKFFADGGTEVALDGGCFFNISGQLVTPYY